MSTRFLLLALAAVTAVNGATPLLLVLEKDDRSLAIVDPQSMKLLGRVDAGDDPHEIVASDDGRVAYISNYGAFGTPKHTLTVVDLAAKKSLPKVDLGALLAPHGLDLAGGKVYFTAEGSKVIGRYDPSSDKIDWVLGIGRNRTHMISVTKDEGRIFTANVNSDTVSILERDPKADVSGWTEYVVPVGQGPEGFDVSPDGKELWAANSHDGTVSIVDVAARKAVKTLNLGTNRSNRLKFTPDGKFVLISDLGTGDLIVVDAATRTEVKKINLGQGCAGILIPPDGARAFVAVSRNNYVAIIDLKSLTQVGRLDTGKGPDGLAWAAGAH
jgi:YVTN family beta-propeller protein